MALATLAFRSSLSISMRSAWWSPHSVTHSPQPLQRSDTKIEKMPPPPAFFFSGTRKMAFTLL